MYISMKPERIIGILNKVTSTMALESPNKLKVLNLIWPRKLSTKKMEYYKDGRRKFRNKLCWRINLALVPKKHKEALIVD